MATGNLHSEVYNGRLYWDGVGDLWEWLKANGLHPHKTPKGFSIRCLNTYHNDKSNSAQVFENDFWWVCYACGERHPLIRRSNLSEEHARRTAKCSVVHGQSWSDPYDFGDYSIKRRGEGDRVMCDYRDYWLTLEPITNGVKGLPAAILNSLGWRTLPDQNELKLPAGIFIPAWNTSRDVIPFFQVRHDKDKVGRRFSFPTGSEPMVFGFESLQKCKKYVPFTEGNSDRATLELAGIPAIAIPSAASGNLVRKLAEWCVKNGKIPVACCDNDKPGEKLLRTLDGVAPYIDIRPPQLYKDYNEMFMKEGLEPVKERLQWLSY